MISADLTVYIYTEEDSNAVKAIDEKIQDKQMSSHAVCILWMKLSTGFSACELKK